MILFTDNYLDRATLTPSSEVPSLPVENILDEERSSTWRTTNDGTETLTIELAAADAAAGVTSFHIINTNISSPVTLTLEANSSNSWGAPAFTQSITLDTGNPALRNLIQTVMFASQTFVWWRVVINGTNADNFFDIGGMYLGKDLRSTDANDSFAWDWLERSVDPSVITRSIGGQEFVQVLPKWREFSVSFPARDLNDMLDIRDAFRLVGINKNIFVAFDYANDPNDLTVYGKFVNMNELQRRYVDIGAIQTLIFKEAL